MELECAKYIPWLPALAAALCGLCATKKGLRWLAAPICILSIFAGFVITVLTMKHVPHDGTGVSVKFFDWINVASGGGLPDFSANFSYFFDPLTVIMLCVVTGIGTLVAIYAAGYMKGDRGYARFFAFVSLFIFAMTNLVMGDNLVLLYLGWEGVGLCSYLLIGYYYDKPSAVAAAKKAFIVNRIGDLGFAIGIFLTYQTFGTVQLSQIVETARAGGPQGAGTIIEWIPYLLMLGAFGKSAQIPLYVWLPDAMEGPTPVSALIHAATMVTAGVYMIARLLPVFQLSPYALPTVACIGALTAIFAATIALCQYDIKRIYAYSTISQLGYMFLGVGVLSTVGGVFHLFTHAFFKALLFLTAGSVMHALAGQLDLRKMSGLRSKMPITCWLMFIGCLALAGFPFFSGFFSKDLILASVVEAARGQREVHGARWVYGVLAVMGFFTAFLTAFYTFRLWFRVFMGPEKYEMGHEHHAVDEDATHASHPHDAEEQAAHEPHHAPAHAAAGHGGGDIHVEHHHEPHEMPILMNAPLVILAIGSVIAGFWPGQGWVEGMIEHSTANPGLHADHHPDGFFIHHGLHLEMQILSGVIAIAGIALAAFFHWINRPAADRVANSFRGVVRVLENKYYIDELNDAVIRKPLRLLGDVFFIFDRLIIDGLVSLVGFAPRAVGLSVRPSQRGMLQGYGLGMAFGAAAIVLLIVLAMR